jgi:uncharacterized membrane protein YccF (DUF307 family)
VVLNVIWVVLTGFRPTLSYLIAGEVHRLFIITIRSLSSVSSGRLRTLAVGRAMVKRPDHLALGFIGNVVCLFLAASGLKWSTLLRGAARPHRCWHPRLDSGTSGLSACR